MNLTQYGEESKRRAVEHCYERLRVERGHKRHQQNYILNILLCKRRRRKNKIKTKITKERMRGRRGKLKQHTVWEGDASVAVLLLHNTFVNSPHHVNQLRVLRQR